MEKINKQTQPAGRIEMLYNVETTNSYMHYFSSNVKMIKHCVLIYINCSSLLCTYTVSSFELFGRYIKAKINTTKDFLTYYTNRSHKQKKNVPNPNATGSSEFKKAIQIEFQFESRRALTTSVDR